jgi:hypothetical protein
MERATGAAEDSVIEWVVKVSGWVRDCRDQAIGAAGRCVGDPEPGGSQVVGAPVSIDRA